MKKKGAIKLLAFCLLCICTAIAITVFVEWNENNVPVPYEYKILGVPVVTDVSFLEGRKRVHAEENPGLCYEDVMLPYDLQGICYLSQDAGQEWIGELTVAKDKKEEFFVCVAEDSYWTQKAEAIRANHQFVVWLVGEEDYYELRLVVTGMPTLVLNESRQELQQKQSYEADPDAYVYDPDVLYYGTVQLFDPGVASEQYEIFQSHIRYYVKGAVTRHLDKKSYSLKLLNYKGEDVKTSLLGMGESETWKLNALATDENKIREITASQIWEMFDAANTEISQPGPKEEYVEVIINNQYVGLYCLVKPVDEHALNLDGNDILYKVVGDFVPTDESIQASIDNGWKVQAPIRIRYPKDIIDYELAWSPIRDWLNTFHRSEMVNYEAVADKVELSNLEDATMFLMVCSASDNQFKNSYYAAKVTDTGRYQMIWCPWDLDFTFGNICDTEIKDISVFNSNHKVIFQNEELARIMDTGNSDLRNDFLARWREYRTTFLSTESVAGMLEGNRDYLIATGAMEREKNRWPEYGISEDIEYLLEFQRMRMEWLDEYFESLVIETAED